MSLWAKSATEAEVVRAVFMASGLPDWSARANLDPLSGQDSPSAPSLPEARPTGTLPAVVGPDDHTPTTHAQSAPPTGSTPLPHSSEDDPSLVMVPQYPVTARTVAQVWRRMRRPARRGPAVELDVAETVAVRSRSGVTGPPVLVPVRRNVARLLLLVDSGGSMLPYQDFVSHIEFPSGARPGWTYSRSATSTMCRATPTGRC